MDPFHFFEKLLFHFENYEEKPKNETIVFLNIVFFKIVVFKNDRFSI